LLAVAACAMPAAPTFQPAALPKPATAIIRGSQDPEPGALRPDSHVFLVAVDGQTTGFDWSHWNDQVPVAPGPHLIEFGPCVCNFALNKDFGYVALTANLAAGKTYYLRSTPPKSNGLFQPMTTTAWIEDDSGTHVTPSTSFALAGAAQGPVLVLPVYVK